MYGKMLNLQESKNSFFDCKIVAMFLNMEYFQ